MNPLFSAFLVVVTAGSFAMQAVRIRRFGAAGVSRATWLGLLVSVTLWSVYGATTSDWTILAANVPVMFVAAGIVVAMARAGAAKRSDPLVGFLGALAAAGIAAVAIGPWVVGAAASVLVVVRILPQLLEAVRAPDVTGVSITTWLGNIANKVPWTIYGLLIADVWVAGGAALAVVLSGVIVLVVAVRRRAAGSQPPEVALART